MKKTKDQIKKIEMLLKEHSQTVKTIKMLMDLDLEIKSKDGKMNLDVYESAVIFRKSLQTQIKQETEILQQIKTEIWEASK